MAINFYIVCKNGSHEDQSVQEAVDRIEVDLSYPEGLKVLRCMTNILKGWMKYEQAVER